jgi:hypothetical protein
VIISRTRRGREKRVDTRGSIGFLKDILKRKEMKVKIKTKMAKHGNAHL